jgi:hypothetical protein
MSLQNVYLLVIFILSTGCVVQPVEPTACDGLAEKTLGITRADYSACAGELLDAMDDLERPLRRYVRGDGDAKVDAVNANRRLRHLMRQVGFQADIYREVGGGISRTIERWPDTRMQVFNQEVTHAAAHYRSALGFPNDDNFQEGRRTHKSAKRTYARFR